MVRSTTVRSSILRYVAAYAGSVPMSPEEFHANAMRAADAEGRLPLSRVTGWDVFPFEQAGLRVVPLAPPVLPEPARAGENGRDCPACSGGNVPVWSDEHWRLKVLAPSGAPLILILEPNAHHDLPDLPDERAAEMGVLTVRIARAIESLPHIARAHVSRWGDGGAHLHVFFFARPAGFSQLRGTCLAIWDDLLPAVPDDQRGRDAAAVARELARSYGGQASDT
jgi:diadenosine tetraphosphate (Ap4A) HIT family hydrolase